jgi:hypothetical protein
MAACMVLSVESAAEERSGCSFFKLADLPITELQDDIAIPVSVNGKTLLMEIATGSPLTFLFKRRVREMTLDTHALEGVDARRAPDFEMTRIDSLNIGSWQALSGKIFVTDTDVSDLPDNVVGVLGEDFLKNIDFEMDLKGARFIAYQANGCSEKSPPLAPESYSFIPFKVTSPQYWARVMFESEVNGHPLKTMLGTDYAHTRLSEQATTKLDIDINAAQPIAAEVASDKGGNGLWSVKLDSFKIGDEMIKPVWLRAGGAGPELHLDGYDWLLGMQEGHWELVLGRDFMRTHRVMVSHSQRRFYYTYLGGPIFAREPNRAVSMSPVTHE